MMLGPQSDNTCMHPRVRTYYKNYNNYYYVGGASKQSKISGWGKHEVRISVLFMRDKVHKVHIAQPRRHWQHKLLKST